MPTADKNLQHWGAEYRWPRGGDEWSDPWGTVELQWYGSILPRLHQFVPAGTILEIAPGHGRWTQFLKDLCDRLIVVDISAECISRCQTRFARSSNISYFVNDGVSLAMVPDESVDFVFSFDSLVHAEADVVDAYLEQLRRKLTPNGAGFIHHSNIGEYARRWAIKGHIPVRLRKYLTRVGVLDYYHWRAFSMTAKRFAAQCDGVGLHCVTQELINWRGRLLIDCFSVFVQAGSPAARPPRVLRNREFMKEAGRLARLADLYGSR